MHPIGRSAKRLVSGALVLAQGTVALAAPAVAPAPGALTLSQVPLFVSTNAQPNVLLLFGNSNSMDEDPSGAAVGSASPSSKSEIARGVVKSLVSTYTGKISLGLMAYQQSLSGGDPVRAMVLHNSPYDVSYDPSNYNPSFSGARESTTKKFRIPNPSSLGDFIHYNVALPFYASSGAGTQFCYSSTARAFNNGELATGTWDTYACYRTKSGTSDAAPGAAGAGYASSAGSVTLYPTDSDLGAGITDFGTRIAWYQVGATWFSNGSPGMGYVHVPIAPLDATQAAKINTKMGTSQFTTNAPLNPAYPLQNAGLTPLDGSVKTAKSYFSASLTDAAQGGPLAAPPNACGKNFLVMLTNGLPSVTSAGVRSADTTTMLSTLASSVGNLYSTTNTETFVIGFALPFGINPAQLDTIANAGNTGTAYNAADQATLTAALGAVFTDILARTASSASVALNTASVSTSSMFFQARFSSADWSGQLLASRVNTDGTPGALVWDAGQVINGQSPGSRVILTTKPSTGKGIPFRWPANPAAPGTSELDVAQVTALNTNIGGVNDGRGADRVAWLRGSAASEGTGTGQFRVRPTSKLGDVVGSAPAYVGAPGANYGDDDYPAFRASWSGRTPVVYVGANDGMVHGFKAATGEELLAYVPSRVFDNLSGLTSQGYAHRYFVDGPLVSGDAKLGSLGWRTLLLVPMGAGARGLSVLDVTDPSSSAFRESNAASIVRFEFTDLDDGDVGYLLGKPALVKLNTGRWAVVFGNGYNGTSTGKAALFVVDAETGALIKKITTSAGSTSTPNGIAGIAAVDADGNRTIDAVYGGDLQGNLWKFDLSASNSSGWGVAFGGSPLFTTSAGGLGSVPITSAPEVSRHPEGGYVVLFGTGKYLEYGDPSTTTSNAFFGIRDNGVALGGSPSLVTQSVTGTVTGSDGNSYRNVTNLTVDWSAKQGWKLTLPESGERVVTDPLVRNGRVIFVSMTPSLSACSAGGSSWLMEVDYLSGGRLKLPAFDSNGDGKVDTADRIGGVVQGGRKLQAIGTVPAVVTGIGTPDSPLERKLITESSAAVTPVLESGTGGVTRRTGWQVIR